MGLPIQAGWKRDAYGRRYKSYQRGPGYVARYKSLVKSGALERQ